MHWVKATAPDGRPCYINLSAVHSMMRHDKVTLCFLGGVTVLNQTDPESGETRQVVHHANTQVLETPAQLLNLPIIEPGKAVEDPITLKPSLPRAVRAQVEGARKVEHVAASKKRRAQA